MMKISCLEDLTERGRILIRYLMKKGSSWQVAMYRVRGWGIEPSEALERCHLVAIFHQWWRTVEGEKGDSLI